MGWRRQIRGSSSRSSCAVLPGVYVLLNATRAIAYACEGKGGGHLKGVGGERAYDTAEICMLLVMVHSHTKASPQFNGRLLLPQLLKTYNCCNNWTKTAPRAVKEVPAVRSSWANGSLGSSCVC